MKKSKNTYLKFIANGMYLEVKMNKAAKELA